MLRRAMFVIGPLTILATSADFLTNLLGTLSVTLSPLSLECAPGSPVGISRICLAVFYTFAGRHLWALRPQLPGLWAGLGGGPLGGRTLEGNTGAAPARDCLTAGAVSSVVRFAGFGACSLGISTGAFFFLFALLPPTSFHVATRFSESVMETGGADRVWTATARAPAPGGGGGSQGDDAYCGTASRLGATPTALGPGPWFWAMAVALMRGALTSGAAQAFSVGGGGGLGAKTS